MHAIITRRTIASVIKKLSPTSSSCGLLGRQQNNTLLRSFSGTTTSSGIERHSTTIICVRKDGKVCMIGDGMVSQGSIIVKPNATKIRRIPPKGSGASSSDSGSGEGDENVLSDTLVGFAGSTADAFTLMERLENKLDEYPGQLTRSCVELAKGWRTDKYLRRLEASLIVANSEASFELTGNGDVLESHDGILGVGSGSPYAMGTYYFEEVKGQIKTSIQGLRYFFSHHDLHVVVNFFSFSFS